MHDSFVLVVLFVGMSVFVAHLFAVVFEKTRIPDVLFLMLVGIIFGPALGFLSQNSFGYTGKFLTMVALILILFEGGIDLKIGELRRILWVSLFMTFGTFLLTVVAVTLIMHHFGGFDWVIGVIVGSALGGMSPAVVIPVVRMLKLRGSSRTLLFVESAVADVLSLVVSAGIVEAYKAKATLLPSAIALQLSLSFLISLLVGMIVAAVWSSALRKIREFPNTIFTTFGVVFIVYSVAELLGGSGAAASFVFGVLLANFRDISHEYRHLFSGVFSFDTPSEVEKSFYGEVIFLLKAFFFFYLGVSFNYVSEEVLILSFMIVFAMIVLRFFFIAFGASSHIIRRDAVIMSVLIPKGLPAVVAGSLLYESGFPYAGVVQDIIYMSVVLSILLSSVLLFIVNRENAFSVISRVFWRFRCEK